MARSISSVLRTSNGVSSIPSDCATDLTAANSPIPVAAVGSRSTKARVTWGAICLSNSAHLPPMLYSKFEKPVILPPGWAMLWTKPAPTGSATFMNTIGIVRVACCSDAAVKLPGLKITSGAAATRSAASRRRRSSMSPPTNRVSITRLRPTAHPNCSRACANTVVRACASASSGSSPKNTPTRRTGSACCAFNATGQAPAPPSNAINLRRLIRRPRAKDPGEID